MACSIREVSGGVGSLRNYLLREICNRHLIQIALLALFFGFQMIGHVTGQFVNWINVDVGTRIAEGVAVKVPHHVLVLVTLLGRWSSLTRKPCSNAKLAVVGVRILIILKSDENAALWPL